jgi:cytochrome P450
MPVLPTDPGWEFDHTDPALAPNLNEVLAAFRGRCPVVHTDKHGGYWAVLSYDAVRRAFSDPQTYSSAQGVIFPSVVVAGTPQPPLEADPPQHAVYRKLIQKYFTRGAVTQHEDLFRELISQRIREISASGAADLVSSLAAYVPPIAIAMILGLPPEDGEKFVSWTGQMFGALVAGDFATLGSLNAMFTTYLREHIELHRERGEDSLINAIAAAQVDGQPMTEAEQVGMILLLVLAGHETTVTSTATMLYHLATVEGLREKLIADPTLIPAMIEESLRLESPGIVFSRVARHDTVLAGQPIGEGDRIVMVISSANHDPAVFDDPDRFQCPRADNPHLSFGHGIHRCVGEHLAKLQLRIVAEQVLRLMPNYRLAEGYEATWHVHGMMRSLATLPANTSDATPTAPSKADPAASAPADGR